MTIKQLREQRAEKIAAARQIVKDAEKETRDLSAEEQGKFDSIMAEADKLKAKIDREERLLAAEDELQNSANAGGRETGQRNDPDAGISGGDPDARPGREQRDASGGETREQREQRAEEHRAAWCNYLRFGLDGMQPEQRSLLTTARVGPNGEPQIVQRAEQRALSVGGIGVVGPRGFSTELVKVMKAFTGVREAGAFVLTTGDGNPFTVPTGNDTTNVGQLLAENTEETNSTDATVGNVTLDGFKYSSKFMKVSLELAQDNAFDLERHLLMMGGERIGRIFNTHTTTGDGSSKPRGFTVAGGTGKVAAATDAITYDELIDLIHSVDPAYRADPSRVGFQMHDTTLAAIRKLKDDQNRPLVIDSLRAGEPDTILGYRYTINNDMAQLTSGVSSKVVAFGRWDKYWIRDVTNPIVLRLTERFAEFGQVAYIIFSRHDGDLTDASAVKQLLLAAA